MSNGKDTCDWHTTAIADEAHVTVTRLRVLSLSLAARRGVRKEVEKRVAHRAFDHWTNLKRHGKRAPKPACHDARRPHSSSADPQIHIATAHCAHIDAGLPALQHLDGIRYSFACCSPRTDLQVIHLYYVFAQDVRGGGRAPGTASESPSRGKGDVDGGDRRG